MDSRSFDAPEPTEIADALRIIGVSAETPWDDIRRAYRRRVRDHHPDLGGSATEATEQTTRLNLAWQTLESATDGGRRPLPATGHNPDATESGPTDHAGVDVAAPAVTLRAPPGDVFVQLLDAAHAVGDVSYIDPEAGLIQVLLDPGGPAASQLLIAVDTEADPPACSFTLDSMQAANAPAIADVVDQIGHHLGTPGEAH